MRDAQSALDQVISFAGDKIKKEDVEMALGVAGADILKRIIDSIAANKPAEAIAAVTISSCVVTTCETSVAICSRISAICW